MNAKEVLEYARSNDVVQIVDLRFTDWPGQWQHCSFPISEVDEGTFEDGMGFDGSSIRGWQAINESDMLMVPDPATAFIDPFLAQPTLVMICNIEDPITREPYSRDPRWIARKAENYLQVRAGVGDTAYFGPEAEFFLFSDARFSTGPDHGFYSVDSREGCWNSGREEAGGTWPTSPATRRATSRCRPRTRSRTCAPRWSSPWSSSASRWRRTTTRWRPRGQCEIDMRFDTMVAMADQLLKYKYVVKNVARRAGGITATFMPKPVFDDNGSGMHTHQSIWKDGNPLFAGDGYAGLLRAGAPLHRRHPEALPRDRGLQQPDHQLLQAAGAGLRGAGQPGAVVAEPLGVVPDPDVLAEPKAKRVEVRYPDPDVPTPTSPSRPC